MYPQTQLVAMQALYSNTTVQLTQLSGYQALYSNTTGSNNTASGYAGTL